MGMGYMGCEVEVIEDEALRELFPSEYEDLELLLQMYQLTVGDLAQRDRYGSQLEEYSEMLDKIEDDDKKEEIIESIDNALVKLRKAFNRKYPKLELCLCYHDSTDEGDRYDEINGFYWNVEGMYELSTAGRRLMKDAKFATKKENMTGRRSYVVYG